jgi:uncharacterized protein YndB with AHSA1/START domain
MNKGLIANVSATIDAPIDVVWRALVNPEMIRQYMFGTETISKWIEGSPITWKGVWEGKPYEDKGIIIKIEPEKMLEYTHFSPLAGLPDTPENYHTLTYRLTDEGDCTFVSLSQDNNSNEQALEHSKKMWKMLLADLKKLLEK